MISHTPTSRRSLVAVVLALTISAIGATLARAQTSVVVAENGGNGALSTFTLGGGSTPTRRITGSLTGLASPT